MKRLVFVSILILAIAAPSFGAVKTYQVTGPILDISADKIVVQKGNDRWELARDSGTKVTGDLKVGAKVTIEYRMTATTINVQAAKKK